MHFEEKGAYTGEIAPNMLKELGVEYGYHRTPLEKTVFW